MWAEGGRKGWGEGGVGEEGGCGEERRYKHLACTQLRNFNHALVGGAFYLFRAHL